MKQKEYIVNKKRRVLIPASIRDDYDLSKAALTLGDRYLILVPEWYLEGLVNSIIGYGKESRRKRRIICSKSYECDLDKMGGTTLPKSMVERAGIKESVIFVEIPRTILSKYGTQSNGKDIIVDKLYIPNYS